VSSLQYLTWIFLQNSKEWCFKKIVYPSLIPCSVPGESRYERGRLWTRGPLGFFLNTIARGVVSDPAEYFAWRHNSSRCFFCFRILSEPKQTPLRFFSLKMMLASCLSEQAVLRIRDKFFSLLLFEATFTSCFKDKSRKCTVNCSAFFWNNFTYFGYRTNLGWLLKRHGITI
jgi:hypothetical protein